MDIATIAADPYGLLAGLKDNILFDVLCQLAVALLVGLLDARNQTHLCSQGGEALFLRNVREILIHLGPFVVLAGRRVFQILQGCADPAVVQGFEPQFRVLLLVARRLLKNSCDLLVALFPGLGRIEGVLIAGLGFPRKCRHQICFGSASF